MCKQKVVLETIKKTKGRGGMTPAQIELAEAQTADYQELKREVIETKKTAEETKSELEYVRGQIDILVKNSQNKPLLRILSDLKDNKFFWFWIIFLTAVVCGVNISDIMAFFTKGS